MTRIQKSIEVGMPVAAAYRQWTQFEEFPKFMEGIDSVVPHDDQLLDWSATVGGQTRSWTAKIVDQTPNVRIAWKAVEGTENAGAVLFTEAGPNRTKVDLTIEVEPEGAVETAGTAFGFLDRRIEGDLERFKTFIKDRGQPTGAGPGPSISCERGRRAGRLEDLGRSPRASAPLSRSRGDLGERPHR